MVNTSRTRKLIFKPLFYVGPMSKLTECFRSQFADFRVQNEEFNNFLIELNCLLEKDNNPDFVNLELLINNKGETKWISPKNTLVDILIKLYNYCFSPKQALMYIKKCHLLYKKMLNAKYNLLNSLEKISEETITIKDTKKHCNFSKSLEIIVEPKRQSKDFQRDFLFKVKFPLEIHIDKSNLEATSLIEIDAFHSTDIVKDTLSLFVYYQDSPLYKLLFETIFNRLLYHKIIEKTKTIEDKSKIVEYYECK